jgi:hypothetical protein
MTINIFINGYTLFGFIIGVFIYYLYKYTR